MVLLRRFLPFVALVRQNLGRGVMTPTDRESFKEINSLADVDESDVLRNYLAAGDLDAFEIMYGVAFESIVRFYRGDFSMDAAEAEDLAQGLFMHVTDRLKEGYYKNIPGKRFTSWLYTIARNFAIDHIESLERQPEVKRFSELDMRDKQGHESDREVDFPDQRDSRDFEDMIGKSEKEKDKEEEEKEKQRAEAERLLSIRARRMKIALLSIDINYQALLLLKYRDGWGYKKIKKSNMVYTSRGKPSALSTLRVIEKKALLAVKEAYDKILAREEADE